MALIAELIAVGTELLLGNVANTDAQMISQGLSELGIHVYFHTVVGDNDSRLRQALDIACGRADIIITTGGLGPTYDDMTKQTLAAYFGLPLERHQPTVAKIRAYFDYIGSQMTPNNERQADLPRGCTIMENNWGTAPGCIFQAKGKHVLMLPGPPSECRSMFRACAMPFLQGLTHNCLVSRNINIFGMGESAVENKLRDMMQAATNPTIAPYAKEGEVLLRVTASAETHEMAEALVTPVVQALCDELGEVVYGVDVGSLEAAVSNELRLRDMTMATAESCTGGLLGGRITALPGASQVYCGGVCAYTPAAKTRLLGVDERLLADCGVVSAETAEAMARGALARFGSDLAVGITGYAGPLSENDIPVGTVFVALCGVDGYCEVKRLMLGASRERVRIMAVNHALNMLRLRLAAL